MYFRDRFVWKGAHQKAALEFLAYSKALSKTFTTTPPKAKWMVLGCKIGQRNATFQLGVKKHSNMPQQEIIFTRGVMGSGKSTRVQALLQERPQLRKVSRDDLRGTLFGDYYRISQENEELITRVEFNLLRRLLREGYDVVIDNLNLRPRYLDAYFREFQQLQLRDALAFRFEVIDYTDLPLDTLLQRNRQRNAALPEGHYKAIPLEVVQRSFEQLQSIDSLWWQRFERLRAWQPPEPIVFAADAPQAILLVWQPTLAEQAPWLARLELPLLIANPNEHHPISWQRLGIRPQLLLDTPKLVDELPLLWMQQIKEDYALQQVLDQDYYRTGYWLHQDCNVL